MVAIIEGIFYSLFVVCILFALAFLITLVIHFVTGKVEKNSKKTKANQPQRIQKKSESPNTLPKKPREEKPILVLFEEKYTELISNAVVKKGENYKPITAAYLFVLTDFMLMKNAVDKRYEQADSINTFLEAKLSKNQLLTYDKAVDLFGNIVRGAIFPRGDWVNISITGNENSFERLFICYGDILRFPDYLNNYETAPITIYGAHETFDFSSRLYPLKENIFSYCERIKCRLTFEEYTEKELEQTTNEAVKLFKIINEAYMLNVPTETILKTARNNSCAQDERTLLDSLATYVSPNLPSTEEFCENMSNTMERLTKEIGFPDKVLYYFADYLMAATTLSEEEISAIAREYYKYTPQAKFLKNKINYELCVLGIIYQYAMDYNDQATKDEVTNYRKARGYLD